jgi:predicted Fe-Mo cluster-binding NifX family protein
MSTSQIVSHSAMLLKSRCSLSIIVAFLIWIPAQLNAQPASDVRQDPLKSGLVAIASTDVSLESRIGNAFGRAPYFIIYCLKADTFSVIENDHAYASGSAGKEVAWELVSRGVDAVASFACGDNARNILNTANIRVIDGEKGTVKDVIARYKKGEYK